MYFMKSAVNDKKNYNQTLESTSITLRYPVHLYIQLFHNLIDDPNTLSSSMLCDDYMYHYTYHLRAEKKYYS